MKFNASLIDLINTETKIKLFRHFMKHEAPMSEREIASVLKVPYTNVNRTLKEFALYNIVNFVTVGKAHLWKLNKKSYAFEVLSKVIQDVSLNESPIENLKNDIKKSIPAKLIIKAVLFGSVAKGEESDSSDIDLFLLVKNVGDKEKLGEIVGTLSDRYLQLYGNRLSAYILTESELKEKKNPSLLQEIDKGISLYDNKA
ncbi:MAG: hypothetical protein A2297_02635 [Elusimicrobia bacterium RIFOXYB2_FULL_48_7]|nr:MAG: hypothetical protein A2297_02635 [Elusimicrobia bacterium RIFOXYB2_FULL_48_7]